MKRLSSPVAALLVAAQLVAAQLVAALLVASLVASTAMAQSGSGLPHRPATGPVKPVDPSKPVPGQFTHPKLKGWINDTPDTGQFLPDSVWILRVGPRVVTVGDFVNYYFSSYPEFRPGVDSLGRVQFLNSLLQKNVLGLAALSQNRPLAFEDRLALREVRQRSLATAVFQRFVADSVTVQESEIRALWETYKWQQHFRHVLVLDRNAAERVRRELVSGKITWAAAVKNYSVADNDPGPEGDLGWGMRSKMDPMVANVIYRLKPGETSLPVQDRQGWHIVQSVERRPQDPPVYEAFRSALRREIRGMKQTVRSEALLALLRVQTGMVYDSSNVAFASSRFGETMKVKQEAMSSSFEIDGSVPEFAPADTSRALATWRGGRFSLGSLLHAYTDIPPVLRPGLNLPDAVFGFVETIVLEPSLAEYGAQKGLENDPLVKRPMNEKLEELMVEKLYQDSVGTRVWVSKDERKAYYQQHLKGFFTFPSVEFAAILRHSKAGADSVERALKAGTDPRAIIAADSANGFVSGTIQTRGQNEQGTYQKALFEEMRPGDVQVRGPDRSGDYAILKVLKYDGGRQLSYAESEAMIDESMQNIKAEAALKAMLARLKARHAVAARPELLMLIKLVDPTLDE